MAPDENELRWAIVTGKENWRKHRKTDPSAHQEDKTTKLCNGCARRVPLDTPFWLFPVCEHVEGACVGCVLKNIHNQLRLDPTWDACTCPICDKIIPEADMRSMLPKGMLFLFDGFIFFLRRLYRAWLCACPFCGTEGYLLPEVRSSLFNCSNCYQLVCMNHGIDWDHGVEGHVGITCSEYDYRHQGTALDDLTRVLILYTTKGCPSCGTRVSESNNVCTRSIQQCKGYQHVADLLTNSSQVPTVTAGGTGTRKKWWKGRRF